MGRTQQGNNNAYCQDNELSWISWQFDAWRGQLLAFVRRLLQIRHSEPVLRRRKFFQGRSIRGKEVKDIAWLDPSGREMTDRHWNSPDARALGVLLSGASVNEVDERGQPIRGNTLLVLYNAADASLDFSLPGDGGTHTWQPLIDTAREHPVAVEFTVGSTYRLEPRSLALLRRDGHSEYPA
jgi:glycogen operon protein